MRERNLIFKKSFSAGRVWPMVVIDGEAFQVECWFSEEMSGGWTTIQVKTLECR